MRTATTRLLLIATLAAAPQSGWTQTPDERAAARAVTAQHSDAVVSVLGTIKVRLSLGGREMQNSEEPIESIATVLDDSGLAVMSLSALEPGSLITRMMTGTTGGAMPKMDVATELLGLRVRLGGGEHVAARIVLRDEDLNLAFLRIGGAASRLAHVAAATATAVPDLLEPLILLLRVGDPTSARPAGRFDYVQAHIDRPRARYVLAGAAGDGTLGAPVFDLKGRFVGLVVIGQSAATSTGGTIASGMLAQLRNAGGVRALQVVVPVDQIRQVASEAIAQ